MEVIFKTQHIIRVMGNPVYGVSDQLRHKPAFTATKFELWKKMVQIAQVVQHPLRKREVVVSIPGGAIPKALKWYQWLPCLVLSIIRQALASLLITNIATNTVSLAIKSKSEKSPIVVVVCIHRRNV